MQLEMLIVAVSYQLLKQVLVLARSVAKVVVDALYSL